MVDKVKPLKMESSSTGGVEDDFSPTEVDPAEDYVATKGIAFENLDTVYIKKDGNDIKFKDLTLTTEYSANQLRTAVNNSFDNSTNGFVSTNVQAAIEEAQSTALGKLVFVVSINRNGSMSGGDWFGRSEVLPNTASFVCPTNMQFIGISWSNANSNCDFDLEFYKNGRTTTKFRTYQARNLTLGYAYGWADSFSAGDYIDVKYIDQGDNVSDMGLDLFFKVV